MMTEIMAKHDKYVQPENSMELLNVKEWAMYYPSYLRDQIYGRARNPQPIGQPHHLSKW